MKKTNKQIIIFSLAGLLLVSSIAIPTIINNKSNSNESSLISSIDNNKGINLVVKSIQSENDYGSQEITYTVTPSFYAGQIIYKLNYFNDDTPLEDNILSILHDVENNKLTITCLKPFLKQIVLTLYAETNESVFATLKIDFIERITPSYSLLAEDNKPLKVNTTVNTTGGSIEVDKTVKNEKLIFNKDFITKANNYLRLDSYNIENYESNAYTVKQKATKYKSSSGKSLYEQETTLVSSTLSTLDPESFTNFTYESFIYSITAKLNIKCFNLAGMRGVSENQTDSFNYTMKLKNITSAHLNDLFNGTNPVFDYSCSINGTSYSTSLPLKLENVQAKDISMSINSIMF